MKKISLLLALICAQFAVIAQQHFHSPNMDKFVGKWIYNKDGKELEVELRVTTAKIDQNTTMDELEGFYIYKSQGKTLDYSKEHGKASLAAGHVQDRVDPNVVKILYMDNSKSKSGYATITFIPGNPDKIKWSLQNKEGLIVRRDGEPKFDRTFSIPDYIILERKK